MVFENIQAILTPKFIIITIFLEKLAISRMVEMGGTKKIRF